MDRQGKLVKKKKAPVGSKNRENFDPSEWALMVELGAVVETFIRG